MHRGSRALTEDAEGPRMSMAMRRQLGIAPAKSPSKTSSAAAREFSPDQTSEGSPTSLCRFTWSGRIASEQGPELMLVSNTGK